MPSLRGYQAPRDSPPGLQLPSQGSTEPFGPGLPEAGIVLFRGRLAEELGVGVSAGGATLVRVQGWGTFQSK